MSKMVFYLMRRFNEYVTYRLIVDNIRKQVNVLYRGKKISLGWNLPL